MDHLLWTIGCRLKMKGRAKMLCNFSKIGGEFIQLKSVGYNLTEINGP